jgi:hypothetical protein
MKMQEIEQGIEPELTRLIEDIDEVYKIGDKILDELKNEALMILPSDRIIVRNSAFFEKLSEIQKERALRIRILVSEKSPLISKVIPGAEVRTMEEANMTIWIYDNKRMLLTQYFKSIPI